MAEAEKKETVAPRGLMSVKRLLETDPCPCKSGKTFTECCRAPLKDGMTPETTLHLLFEERDATDPNSLSFYAFMTQRMTGDVKPETIVENISKRLHSPPVARALDRLEWHAANSKGLKMTMAPMVQGPPPKELLDAEGNPVK